MSERLSSVQSDDAGASNRQSERSFQTTVSLLAPDALGSVAGVGSLATEQLLSEVGVVVKSAPPITCLEEAVAVDSAMTAKVVEEEPSRLEVDDDDDDVLLDEKDDEAVRDGVSCLLGTADTAAVADDCQTDENDDGEAGSNNALNASETAAIENCSPRNASILAEGAAAAAEEEVDDGDAFLAANMTVRSNGDEDIVTALQASDLTSASSGRGPFGDAEVLSSVSATVSPLFSPQKEENDSRLSGAAGDFTGDNAADTNDNAKTTSGPKSSSFAHPPPTPTRAAFANSPTKRQIDAAYASAFLTTANSPRPVVGEEPSSMAAVVRDDSAVKVGAKRVREDGMDCHSGAEKGQDEQAKANTSLPPSVPPSKAASIQPPTPAPPILTAPIRPPAHDLMRFVAHLSGLPITDDLFNFSLTGLDYGLALTALAPSALDLATLCWSVTPITAQIEANLSTFLYCAYLFAENLKLTAALSGANDHQHHDGTLPSDVDYPPTLVSLLVGQDGGKLTPASLQPTVHCASNHLRVQMWLYDLAQYRRVNVDAMLATTNMRERRAQLREFFSRPQQHHTADGYETMAAPFVNQYLNMHPQAGGISSSATLLASSIIIRQSLAGPSLPLHPFLVEAGLAAVSAAAAKREKEDADAAAIAASKAAKAATEAAALQNAANSSAASRFKGVPSCASRMPNRLAAKEAPALPLGKKVPPASSKPPAPPANPTSALPCHFQHDSVASQLSALASVTLQCELAEAQLKSALAVLDVDEPDYAMLLCSVTRTVPLPTN